MNQDYDLSMAWGWLGVDASKVTILHMFVIMCFW